MGYFTDCGLLVLLSFLRLFYRLPDAGFLIAFLCTVILVCSTYALGKKCIRIVLAQEWTSGSCDPGNVFLLSLPFLSFFL